ncbi:hypothetical protein L596_000591 [Steinernema carpocapsae]|uniref:Uncharacterized protein n=1 Tax=Steinernema carpocapsae TaxID=34508 RepID=A0A4U8UII8_STECR|nr:hypothetical protein L596_000591 [Steinernema carpocapsae]
MCVTKSKGGGLKPHDAQWEFATLSSLSLARYACACLYMTADITTKSLPVTADDEQKDVPDGNEVGRVWGTHNREILASSEPHTANPNLHILHCAGGGVTEVFYIIISSSVWWWRQRHVEDNLEIYLMITTTERRSISIMQATSDHHTLAFDVGVDSHEEVDHHSEALKKANVWRRRVRVYKAHLLAVISLRVTDKSRP